jgi:hypothetical protein
MAVTYRINTPVLYAENPQNHHTLIGVFNVIKEPQEQSFKFLLC